MRLIEVIMKTCSKCKIEYEATTENFHKKRAVKSGLCSLCKVCCRKHLHRDDNDGNYERGDITFLDPGEHVSLYNKLRKKEVADEYKE